MQTIDTDALKKGFDVETYIAMRIRQTGKGRNRIDAVCPFHTKTGDNNNFSYYSDTKTWHCFGGCGGGDIITFVQKETGKDFKAACEHLGFDASLAPTTTPRPKPSPQPLLEKEQAQTQKWKDTAEKMVKWCEGKLWDSYPNKLAYLNERGLSDEIIRSFRIGYNPKTLSRPLEGWGFNPLDYKKGKKLTILKGYTIPWVYNGHVTAIAIRLEGGGYGSVMGGVKQTMFSLDKVQSKPVLVVETELDAVLINLHLGEFVTGVATGAVGCGRGFISISTLLLASKVLLAFDNDPPSVDGKLNAGDSATAFWLKTLGGKARDYRTPPQYKDIGQMFDKGGDIVKWIKDGLAMGTLPPRPTDLDHVKDTPPPASDYSQIPIDDIPFAPSPPLNAYTG